MDVGFIATVLTVVVLVRVVGFEVTPFGPTNPPPPPLPPVVVYGPTTIPLSLSYFACCASHVFLSNTFNCQPAAVASSHQFSRANAFANAGSSFILLAILYASGLESFHAL